MTLLKQRTKNVQTMTEAHQHFSNNELDLATRNVADNFVYTDHARGMKARGRQGFIDWLAEWKKSFSDGHIGDPEYIDAGEWVIARFVGRGTNDGPLGDFPPTGKHMNVPMLELSRFNDVGQLVAGEIYYDQMSILAQLGHVAPPDIE